MGLDRVLEDRPGIVPVEQQRRIEVEGARGDGGEREHGDEDLRGIDRDRPSEQARRQPQDRCARLDIDDEAQRPSGKKHEQFGRIRQREIAMGEALVEQARHMVDEDRDEGEAAPEIDLVRLPHAGLRPAGSPARETPWSI